MALFLFAIALTVWYAGLGPAMLATVLSILCFMYFFSPPVYSFAFSVADVPAILILLGFALLIIRFSAVRRRIEGQLLQARDELQLEVVERTQQASLLNLTHDAIFVRDMSATITYWNHGAEEMYGWTADEASGKVSHSLLKTVFPEALEQIEAKLLGAGRWEGQLVHTKKDGTPVIVGSRWSLQQNNQGTPIAILEINNDITEQKRAEQARQEIEEQWKAAFESNPTMYFIVDAVGAIVSVNAFGAEQLGYTVGELVGRPVLNVFYGADREAVQNHAKECFEHPGRMKRWEARKICKDGSMLWVRETANAVSLRNRPVLLVICEDITEQKRAEEVARRSEKELRDIVETMPAMAWSALPDGSNAFVTRQWTEYTGLSAEQSSGSGWQSTVHPEDLAGHSEEWLRSLSTGQPYEHETRLRRATDGQYRWFLIRGIPLRDEQGNVLKWYGLATDIEDRKRAEALLAGEKRILEMVAKGDSLAQILDSLCRLVEEQASDVLASIFLVEGNRLRHGGAPSLPKAYTDAIEEVGIGPSLGSCGTAAYCGEQVIVQDIATDPLWADFREAALSHSLRACWSTPVFSSQGKVIATFAMYYREPRSPSLRDQESIKQITYLAGVAIERKLTQEALRRSEAYLAEAQKLTKTGSWGYNPFTGKTLYWSEEMFRIFRIDPQEGPSSEKFWLRVHPEDRNRVRARVEREAQEKTEYVDEYRMVLPDGTVKHILDIGHPVFNGAGDVTEFVGTTVDITERKRAEETLRRSEAYLAEAQRLSKTGSWAWNPVTGKPLYWSEEMFGIFGLDPQEGVPTTETFFQRIHPEDLDRTYELLKKAALENMDYEHEHRIVLPDGTVKHIHAIGHPVLDENGRVTEYVGTAMDVTERTRAEQALRRSEGYLAEAQRLSKTGSWAWDPVADKVLYWSAEMFRIFGFDSRERIPTGPEFGQRIDPDDKDRVFEHVQSSVRQKTDYIVDHRIVLPDGTVRHIETIGHPVVDSSGELVEYVGTAMDVTERKRAEEELHAAETRFRTSVDHLTDALFIHDDQDDQGRIIDVNQQACDSLGYTREELIGMTAFDYDAVQDAAGMISIKEQLARGETFSFESAHRRKDGTVFPVEVRVRPFWYGEHRFGLAVVRNITERKRSEQERERLRQLEADLARLNRVSIMGELAASLSHEIKQPIAAVAMNAKTGLRWLQREPPDANEVREALSRIVNDAKRAVDIIERNRSLYRGDTPKREAVDLNEIVREMIALLVDAASRQSVSIRAELDGDVAAITADRVQMQQVLMNLMLNGIEAMKDTGGELTIRSKKTEERQILLSVSDVGCGLPGENADRVFDAFFTTKAQGTGMGLSICRRIIESHGGRLWACANAERGTIFHFTLPIAVSTSSTAA